MSRPTVKFFDAVTQEEIIREMNDEEYKAHIEIVKKAAENETKLQQAKEAKTAAEAKLAALGLTADDLQALGL